MINGIDRDDRRFLEEQLTAARTVDDLREVMRHMVIMLSDHSQQPKPPREARGDD